MLVTVGRIGRAHGVRGDLLVEVRTDTPELRFVEGATLTTEPESAGPLTITRARWHSGRLLLQFAGVADRTRAEMLRGVLLLSDTDDDAPAGPDEYYDHQLVGLRVRTTEGDDLGEVTEVVHLPGQELLSVRRSGAPEVLVPFVAAIVPRVDLDEHVVIVDPPEGLLG